MYKIKCLNNISEKGLKLFGNKYEIVEDINQSEAILVRSANMHDIKLSEKINAIARAGAGVNNIPLEECSKRGMVVFNTPGANANGVKELVLCAMIMASRNVIKGCEWVKSEATNQDIAKLAEKKKSEFVGNELVGKKLGVVGLGAIGILVANAAEKLGMEVYGYDPYISVDGAWKLSKNIKHIENPENLYSECDFITIHIPLMEQTKKIIDEKAFDLMKKDVVVLNFSRDTLVDENAISKHLESGKIKYYVTDFPNVKVVNMPNTIIIPHLGASTLESEENCAIMAVKELKDYLEYGNIKNSVNYPDCDLGKKNGDTRITIHHKNIPNMIGQFTAILAENNIANMINRSQKNYAYSMFDIEDEVKEHIIEKIEKVEGVIKIRII